MSKCLVAGIRFVFAGLLTLLWCLFFTKNKVSISGRQIKYAMIYGLLGTAFQYAFTYIGISRIDGSKAAIFDQLCVFIIVLASGIFFKEDKLNIRKVFGCALGFIGALVISTPVRW